MCFQIIQEIRSTIDRASVLRASEDPWKEIRSTIDRATVLRASENRGRTAETAQVEHLLHELEDLCLASQNRHKDWTGQLLNVFITCPPTAK